MTAASTAPASAKIISLSEERASIRRRSLQRSAGEVGEQAFARAGAYDEDSAYPTADVAALHESGLITAVLPLEFGGSALSGPSLSEVLQSIGSGSLPLGRVFEGHVNAIELVLRYGDRDQVELLAREAREGKMFGVWNTNDANNLRPIRSHRALLARRPKDPGVGRRPYRTSPRDRDRRRWETIDDPAQIAGFRSCRSFGLEGARHARFRDRRRRFPRRRSRADRDRRARRRLGATTLVFRGRMALRRGAPRRHGEIARSSPPPFAGNQPRTGSSSGGASRAGSNGDRNGEALGRARCDNR